VPLVPSLCLKEMKVKDSEGPLLEYLTWRPSKRASPLAPTRKCG